MGSFWIPWAPFGVHGPYQILKDTYQILKETYPILKETYQILSTPKGLGFWFWTQLESSLEYSRSALQVMQ